MQFLHLKKTKKRIFLFKYNNAKINFFSIWCLILMFAYRFLFGSQIRIKKKKQTNKNFKILAVFFCPWFEILLLN